MTRTHNPIEAISEAVTPYVVTGEAAAALEAWKQAEPVLSLIERFDQLQAVLATAAESYDTGYVLPAMLRLYDAGDSFACLVVLEAFVPPLYRAAIALRFRVRHSLEECTTRMLFAFCSAVWLRREGFVAGAALVAQAKCEADHRVEIERRLAGVAPATGRFAGLRYFWEEVVGSASLLDDLVWIVRNECGHHRRAKAAARGRWEVLGGTAVPRRRRPPAAEWEPARQVGAGLGALGMPNRLRRGQRRRAVRPGPRRRHVGATTRRQTRGWPMPRWPMPGRPGQAPDSRAGVVAGHYIAAR